MINQSPNQGLPEVIRVRAQRGFRGVINGKFGIANPGDIVEVPRHLAMEMRACGRAVMTDEPLKAQTEYIPERKKPENRIKADPAHAHLIAMTKAFEGMQRAFETWAGQAAAAKKAGG